MPAGRGEAYLAPFRRTPPLPRSAFEQPQRDGSLYFPGPHQNGKRKLPSLLSGEGSGVGFSLYLAPFRNFHFARKILSQNVKKPATGTRAILRSEEGER